MELRGSDCDDTVIILQMLDAYYSVDLITNFDANL